ncbi:MAG: 23S rRNA (pseudouridine(1915)-N(3))-methyltransferase RlmH [Bacteroidales bacterium]|nr:23S rRNA (pseudouridine(1915)-N(3))-methyltransferase RlmH [Bacteroidales bacterium]
MKITFLTVGKTTFPFVKEGCDIFIKRIKHYTAFEYIEIPELKNAGGLSKEQIKQKEGELILKNIKNTDKVVLLDERGKTFTSINWSKEIEKEIICGTKSLVFIVGGAYGFAQTIYDRADAKLSLSSMTFSHQIIRLFFIEQLYRAFTIIKGEPYHNE